jgi:hypothetical protein
MNPKTHGDKRRGAGETPIVHLALQHRLNQRIMKTLSLCRVVPQRRWKPRRTVGYLALCMHGWLLYRSSRVLASGRHLSFRSDRDDQMGRNSLLRQNQTPFIIVALLLVTSSNITNFYQPRIKVLVAAKWVRCWDQMMCSTKRQVPRACRFI